MNKSPIRKVFVDNLVSLNDQLCFFLFAERELERQLEDFSPAVGKLYTSDVFARNEFAPKIHVTIEKLPDFQNRNRTFTFGTYFSTSYEVASEYYDSALALIEACYPNKLQRVAKGINKKGQKATLSIENAYYETLKASGCVLPDLEVIHTLSYIRFRRNTFIHIGDELSEFFQDLITSRGVDLNKYWGSALRRIDFTSTAVFRFEKDETIELLKLLRIIIERLDDALVKSLNPKWILKNFIAEEYRKKPFKLSPQSSKEFAKKIKKMVQIEFGLICTAEEALEAFSDVSKAGL
jgi:hypothetical protein